MTERSDQQVETSRRLLRAILNRRDFVHAGLVGALGLAGCSSGDSGPGVEPPPAPPPPPPPAGSIPDGFRASTGSVVLPTGSQLEPTDLSVDVLGQTVPLSAAAGFSVGLPPSGPSLALLLDGSGDGVLMAMFDPGATSHTISAHTTSVALLYYATSAYMFPAPAMSQILALIDSDPALATLDAAIANAVAADPRALANNAAAIGPAITGALQAMGLAGAASSGAAPKSSLQVNPPRLPAAKLQNVPTLMTITPSADQNGVMVSQDAATTSLLISNTKRRPCRVYVYQLEPDLQTGPVPASLVAGPFALDSTEALNLFSALKDFTTFFHGLSPWSPVNLPAVPLALAPATADQTTYQVVVIASAFKSLAGDTYEPSIYRDAHFAREIGAWRIDEKNLLAATFFGDICFPILCFLLGAGTIQAARSVIAGVIAAAATAYTVTFNRILSQLEYGSVGQLKAGLAAVVRDAIASDTSTQFWKAEIQQVIGQAESRALAAQTAAQASTRMSRAGQMYLNVFAPIFAVGAVLEGFDLGAVLLDFCSSDVADSWAALLIRQKLNLNPQNPRISPGERVTFQVSNPANTPGSTFAYDWTQTSALATLSAVGEANVGSAITTSQLSVDLVTTGSDVTPINVVVVGYDTSKTPREEIGRAGTTVSFLQRAEILPANPAVKVGEQRLFSVNVDGTLPSGVHYRWTLTGSGGAIGETNVVTTTLPQINYTGVATGSVDQLQVEVLDAGGTVVARATTNVTTLAPFIDLTVSGNWANNTAPALGHYHFTDFVGGRAPNPVPGLDALLGTYDRGSIQDDGGASSGILISLVIPAGYALRAGQTFTKWVSGPPTIGAGQFQFSTIVDLNDPDNSLQVAPGNSGTFTVTAITIAADGTGLFSYTFTVSNGGGGTISGNGVAPYK
jgi:hypothetical protein